jgi:hypothetical protein
MINIGIEVNVTGCEDDKKIGSPRRHLTFEPGDFRNTVKLSLINADGACDFTYGWFNTEDLEAALRACQCR